MTTAPQRKGRTAVVTGATSGIGAEIADQLAGHGAHLVLVARTALTAPSRRRPAIVDGGGNALQTFIFSRLLPAGIAARVGKRIIESTILHR